VPGPTLFHILRRCFPLPCLIVFPVLSPGSPLVAHVKMFCYVAAVFKPRFGALSPAGS